MSALERDYPWHAEFLKWHNEVIKQYKGPIRAELWSNARDWIVKELRFRTLNENNR